jgi:hypothetical protein
MEPDLTDAYWHRHLLYLLQDKKKEALGDLNFMIKKNKKHAGAWRSRYSHITDFKELSPCSVRYHLK